MTCQERISSIFPGPTNAQKYKYSSLDSDDNDIINIHLPQIINPYTTANAGIFLSYLNVGFAYYFLVTPVAYYLIEYQDTSAQSYRAFVTLIALPWSFKIFFALMLDRIALFGYRRKPWLCLAWILYVGTSVWLSLFEFPSLETITWGMFVMAFAYMLAEFCTDGLCVSRLEYEHVEIKGSFSTSAFVMRTYGYLVGAALGALLYNSSVWEWGLSISQVFLLNALIATSTVFPLMWQLEEIDCGEHAVPSFASQLADIWAVSKNNAVWKAMLFIFLYNCLQVNNSAWSNFLLESEGFSNFDLGLVTFVSSVSFFLGAFSYNSYFSSVPWRTLYANTSVVRFLLTICQVVVVLHWNDVVGVPTMVFVLLDSFAIFFTWGLLNAPPFTIYTVLCETPTRGNENLLYVLHNTIHNVAWLLSCDVSVMMTGLWAVDNATISAGDTSGVLKLTVLTSVVQLMGLAFLWLMPESKDKLVEDRMSGKFSWWGGAALLLVTTATFLFVVVYSVAILYV